MRCIFVSRRTGLRCRHAARHAGPHEPGAPNPESLDDPSEEFLAYGARRDDELRDEERT